VLKPDGQFLYLELSRVDKAVLGLKNIPTSDYSMSKHLEFPEELFRDMIRRSGFNAVDYHNTTFGVAGLKL